MELGKKKLTKEGRERKDRIIQRIFTERALCKMIMGLYSSVFPLLKSFVLLFEMKELLIHQVHEEQTRLLKEFVSCSMKPEVINSATSSSKLKKLDIKDPENHLNPRKMFMGIKCQCVVESSTTKGYVVKSFLKQMVETYIGCGKTLQDKLPLNNIFFKCVSAIHSEARGHTLTQSYLQKLPTLAPNALEESELDMYELEIRQFQVDNKLDDYESGSRIDVWWGKDGIVKTYPCLCKMVKAVLSCFHGPQVESSFNIMNDIIDNKSGRINMETYNSIQTIKYSIKASGKSAVDLYKKKDFMHEKISPALCKHMRGAWKHYKLTLQEKKAIRAATHKKLKIAPKGKMLTKRKAKELSAKAAKKARMAHSS